MYETCSCKELSQTLYLYGGVEGYTLTKACGSCSHHTHPRPHVCGLHVTDIDAVPSRVNHCSVAYVCTFSIVELYGIPSRILDSALDYCSLLCVAKFYSISASVANSCVHQCSLHCIESFNSTPSCVVYMCVFNQCTCVVLISHIYSIRKLFFFLEKKGCPGCSWLVCLAFLPHYLIVDICPCLSLMLVQYITVWLAGYSVIPSPLYPWWLCL